MTDRELLELVAKASWFEYSEEQNPLNRDDLALRLAVKLGLLIDCDNNLQEIEIVLVMRDGRDDYERIVEPYGDDQYAATRRAIVRAAAAVQLNKEQSK